jgi:hypothetical protein
LHLVYNKVVRDGFRVSVVIENYPEKQISKENFVDIQRAVGDMLMSSLRRGSPQAGRFLLDKRGSHYGLLDEAIKNLQASSQPALENWEFSRLEIAGLDALPTYKRLVAWVCAP